MVAAGIRLAAMLIRMCSYEPVLMWVGIRDWVLGIRKARIGIRHRHCTEDMITFFADVR